MNLESIEGLTPDNNFVLIRPSRNSSELTTESGVRLYVETSYEKEKHAVTEGRVIAMPNDPIFNIERGDKITSLDFDTDFEIEVEDKVYFHYLTSQEALTNGRAIQVVDELLFLVPYDRLFGAKKDVIKYIGSIGEIHEKPVMINGWLLIEPIDKEVKTSIQLPDYMLDNKEGMIGILRHVSSPLSGYRDFPDIDDQSFDIKPGDKVLFVQHSDIPMQYEYHANFDGNQQFYRMQRKDLKAILKEDQMIVEPLSDNILVKPVGANDKSSGGVIIPDSAKIKPQEGEVISIGPGKTDKDITKKIQCGCHVLYSQFSGTTIQIEEQDYIILNESEILATITK